MRTFFIVLGLAAVSFSAPAFAAADKDPIVAKVNGEDMHYSRVGAPLLIGMMGGINMPVMNSPLPSVAFPSALNQALVTHLMAKAATDKGLQNDLQTKAKLQAADEQVLAMAYVNAMTDERATDEKIQERYKNLVTNFVPVDEVKLGAIQAPTEQEAKDLIKQLKSGGDFDKIAAGKPKDPMISTMFGPSGYVPAFNVPMMNPEVGEILKKMKKGDVVDTPLKSGNAFAVIKLLDQRKSEPPKLEAVRDQIFNQIRMETVSSLSDEVLSKAKIERYNADGTPMAADSPATMQPLAAPALQPPGAPNPR